MKKMFAPAVLAAVAAVAVLGLTGCSAQQADPAWQKALAGRYGKDVTVQVADPGQKLTGALTPVFCGGEAGTHAHPAWKHCELGKPNQQVASLRSLSGAGWDSLSAYPATADDRSTDRFLPTKNTQPIPAYTPGPQFCTDQSTVFTDLTLGTGIALTDETGAPALDAAAYGPGFVCPSASVGQAAAQDAAFQQISAHKLTVPALNALPAKLNAKPGEPFAWTNPVTGKSVTIGTALIKVETKKTDGKTQTVITVPTMTVTGPLSDPYNKDGSLSGDAAAAIASGTLTYSTSLTANPSATKGQIIPMVCTGYTTGTWQECQQGAPVQLGQRESLQNSTTADLTHSGEWASAAGVIVLPTMNRICLPDENGDGGTPYAITTTPTGAVSVFSCQGPAYNNRAMGTAMTAKLASGQISLGQLRTSLAGFCDAPVDTTAKFATACAFQSANGKTLAPAGIKTGTIDPYTTDSAF